MSIQGGPPYSPNPNIAPTAPVRPAFPSAANANAARGGGFDGLSFDRFQQRKTQPTLSVSAFRKVRLAALHPFRSLSQLRHLPGTAANGETLFQKMHMYDEIRKNLTRSGRKQLKNLLKTGVLADRNTDDGHSALYHLYSILKTQRRYGLDNQTILRETVDLIAKPYVITQKFKPISENAARQILQVRNNPTLNRVANSTLTNPVTREDLKVTNSATCVASSTMYYMADKMPAEFARHVNEATSPMGFFFEKVKLGELSPEDPEKAYEILKAQNIKYYNSAPGEVTVKVEVPATAHIRAADSQTHGRNQRGAVETTIQSAYTYLATRSYDPATDLRDSENPGETSKGLTETEKTLMETIIKDNGGVQSVTYQVVAGKSNPQPGEEGNSYLYGYTRPFEQTASDITEALKMGEFVIIGITDTDASGAIVGGHEITITSAFVDKKDGQLKFLVADSDDDTPSIVVRSAREIIPRIHHAGMPLKLAERINNEIKANSRAGKFFTPDETDMASFTLLASTPESFPPDALLPQADPPPETPQAEAQNTPQQLPANTTPQPGSQQQQPAYAQQPQQVIDWVPVMQMPYAPYGMPYSPYGYPSVPYMPAYNGGFRPMALPQIPNNPFAPQQQQPGYSYPPQNSQPSYDPQSSYPQAPNGFAPQQPSYAPQGYGYPAQYPQQQTPSMRPATPAYPYPNPQQPAVAQSLARPSAPAPNVVPFPGPANRPATAPGYNYPPQQQQAYRRAAFQ